MDDYTHLNSTCLPSGSKITSQCQNCDQPYSHFRHEKKRKFCSAQCGAIFARKAMAAKRESAERIETACAGCGVKFKIPASQLSYRNQRYCSQKCHHAANDKYKEVTCALCAKTFRVLLSILRKRVVRYCSRECLANANKANGKVDCDAIYKMKEEGMTGAQIAKILGISSQVVNYRLKRQRFRFNTKKSGQSRASFRRQWGKGKSCLICGFDRCIDAAHIVSHRNGGTMDDENLIPLCPNHHRLFDASQLLAEEAEQLKHRIPDYLKYVGK